MTDFFCYSANVGGFLLRDETRGETNTKERDMATNFFKSGASRLAASTDVGVGDLAEAFGGEKKESLRLCRAPACL